MHSSAGRTGLRRIPIAHPFVLAGSLATLGAMIYWSLRTDLQPPGVWVVIPVCLLVAAANERSRRRSRPAAPPVQSSRPVLGLDD